MADLTIRPVDTTNEHEMTKLYKAIRMAENASRVPHVRKDRILGKLENDVDHAYMFQRGAYLLGAARISSDPSFRYIKDFAIFKPHQGKGYGTAAFQKLLDKVPGEGPISLDVGIDNDRAQKLYGNAGFRKVHQWKSTGNWRMQKDAAMSTEERTLRRLAKPYYVPTGSNSWEHVQQVLANAGAMTQQIYGRPLTLEEKAAILFHDSAVKPSGTHKQHGQHAQTMVIPLLARTGFFNKKQLDEIGTAILEHDTLDDKGLPFSSTTGEVLASGDTEPPELPWVLNKIYNWHLMNNPDKAHWKDGMYESANMYFGPTSKARKPTLYNLFHKDRLQNMRKQIGAASPDDLWEIAMKYRKRHRIADDVVRTPYSSLMKAAAKGVGLL